VTSAYRLQKLIRDINRSPHTRASFTADPEGLVRAWGLEEAQADALVRRDYGALYRMGVHGLLLRPFSLLHDVPEPEYLRQIRDEQP
jgi:hypothetical protein